MKDTILPRNKKNQQRNSSELNSRKLVELVAKKNGEQK